jgi:glycosyltransferase involved in cell wall biosynthesis
MEADHKHETARLRVLMLDLLPAVPYYTAHLCSAFSRIPAVDLRLASATYAHDAGCFQRLGVSPARLLCDIGSRVKIPALRRIIRLGEMVANLTALAFSLLASRPQVLHVQFTPLLEYLLPFELWFVRFAKALGITIVVTVHNVLPHQARPVHRAAYKRVYALADALICHDQNAKGRIVTEFGIPSERVRVIAHGPLFTGGNALTPQVAREQIGVPTRRPIVLWQGIIRPYKGIRFLLRAWRQIATVHPEALLLIVGTGDEAELKAIASDIEALGISSTVQTAFRFISVEELCAYHTAADMIVYPYESITSSGALLTGMAHGKATVASSLPAFENILADQQSALLVPFGDTEAWTAAMCRLLEDETLRNRLGASLRDLTHRTSSWTEIAHASSQLYTDAVNLKFRTAAVAPSVAGTVSLPRDLGGSQ